jgi:Cu+-exporting ATPase
MEDKGSTVVLFSISKKIEAAYAISDKIRADSKNAISKLKAYRTTHRSMVYGTLFHRASGLKTFMVTGDNERVAAAIAREAGIDEYFSDVLPEEKAKIVEKLQAQGMKIGFVGDGINDAPAIAISDLGIAMGSGTDIAIETGDIILMKNSLMDVYRAIKLSNATLGKIKQNLFWALIYNVIGIPVAAGVLYPAFGILLSPMIAGGAMALSSVSVVTNSLLLSRIRLSGAINEK